MKFISRITLSLSAVLLVFIAVWGFFFFRIMVSEINDETDDMLEEYSQDIIMRWLSGSRLPSTDNGTNNTYYVRRVTPEYAASLPNIRYEDSEIYMTSKKETEPARIRRQVFMDSEGAYHELTVAIPSFERQDLIRSILWSIAVLYLILLIAVILISVVVVMYNMRPFRSLLKWLDSYVPGKKNAPVPSDTDIIEFRRLAGAVQNAADRFERQYDIQKQFISNASHELQTPLAVCSGRIEMLLDGQGLSEEMTGELIRLRRTVDDMTRLNRTLLLMSKIENGQFLDTETVDLGALIEEKVRVFGEIYGGGGLKVDMVRGGRLEVKMNGQLASMLVGNLLKNAFVHSEGPGVIRIEVTPEMFSVSNPGTAPLDGSRVFTRFYQENSRKEGSTGLGLSLVKAVCDDSGFSVAYSYADGRHVFTVSVATGRDDQV